MSNKLVMITGPSGSGKTTLENNLVSNGLAEKLISTTTRSPRPGEIDGKDYFFVSNEHFGYLCEAGEMLEKAEFGGKQYGLTRTAVSTGVGKGKPGVVVVEPSGVSQLKTYCEDTGLPFSVICLIPPLSTTLTRLILRSLSSGINQETVRLLVDRLEVFLTTEYDNFYNSNTESLPEILTILMDSRTTIVTESALPWEPAFEKVKEILTNK